MNAVWPAIVCVIIQVINQVQSYTDCELQRQGPSPEWAKPKCNPDGSYKIYQCDAYTRTECWCVYNNGQMVPGTLRKVYDPEQEKRDLANCAKAIAAAPKAPPAAPAPSPVLDSRLGYNLATAQIPEISREASAPQQQPCPASCPAPCPLDCAPAQQSMINVELPPVQIQVPQAPPPSFYQPMMPTPQITPCPQPCQGVYCPPGCPQTYNAPLQQNQQFLQQQQMQCPQFCSANCPPGCPTTHQFQTNPMMPQQYQMIQPQQQQMIQPQQQQMIQPQQQQMIQPPQQQPFAQFASSQQQPFSQMATQQQQQCPYPCTDHCPPGCSLQFMDPATGLVQQPQQLYSTQHQQQQQQYGQNSFGKGRYNNRKYRVHKPALRNNRYAFKNVLKNHIRQTLRRPANVYKTRFAGKMKNAQSRKIQENFFRESQDLNNLWEPW